MRAILQEIPMKLIHNMCSEITLLKLHPSYLTGADDWSHYIIEAERGIYVSVI